nr:uncharacterized protein LOC9269908 [Oryza sativa Japonica Group]
MGRSIYIPAVISPPSSKLPILNPEPIFSDRDPLLHSSAGSRAAAAGGVGFCPPADLARDVSSCSVHPCRRHNSMARWLKLEKDDKRRLCQWWWRHWNAILVVILDMGIVKARRRWPTFTPCQNWINNDGNSSAGP